MLPNELIEKLTSLQNNRPVCLVGAAIVDRIVDVHALPLRGEDVEARERENSVGGCALNVAIALHRLGFSSTNGLIMGRGPSADLIKEFMRTEGISSALHSDTGDNGWCLALVEPDGERSFISVPGVEAEWSRERLEQLKVATGCLIYLSGYQLLGEAGDEIVSWLESLEGQTELYIDFGPRISSINPVLISRILQMRPIISVNSQEAEFFNIQGDIENSAKAWSEKTGCSLIVRMDSRGAYFHPVEGSPSWALPIPARVIDTIGAGDTHAGGVLAGLSAGWSLADALYLGNAVASYVVSHTGGYSSPSIDDLGAYLRDL